MFDYKDAFRPLRCDLDIQPAASLLDVPLNVEVLHVTKKTKALERLSEFRNLRVLNAYEIDELSFSQICTAAQITHLGANIFGIKDIRSLGKLVNLRVLELTDNTKITALDGIEALTKLQIFSLVNCPITVDLTPLSTCSELRYIWLSSRYAKPMRVSSLSPLSGLTKLEHIKLKNVRVDDRQLTALHNLTELVEIDLPDFFSHQEFLALSVALPHARGPWLDKHSGRV